MVRYFVLMLSSICCDGPDSRMDCCRPSPSWSRRIWGGGDVILESYEESRPRIGDQKDNQNFDLSVESGRE